MKRFVRRTAVLSLSLFAFALATAAIAPESRAQSSATADTKVAASGAPVFDIDMSHSTVAFTVRHWFSNVTGNYSKFNGTITGDIADPASAQVAVEIDAASITTRNDNRDEHLKSPDFFDVATYPKITFQSTGVKMKDKTHGVLSGNLTLHGVTKPVELQFESLGAGDLGKAGYRAGFAATTTVNRKDYNIVWNRALDNGQVMLGDDVLITLNVEAVKKDPVREAAIAKERAAYEAAMAKEKAVKEKAEKEAAAEAEKDASEKK